MQHAQRQIRAAQTDDTLIVYQAYSAEIAEPTAAAGRFPDWYNRNRMTWIKPSFLWMMYRCGWAGKAGQEHVLAIRVTGEGFRWALRHAALSHYDRRVHDSQQEWQESLRQPVRIQWDPERDLHHRPLEHRAIQIGLSGPAVAQYADDWIVSIEDITGLVHRVHRLVRAGDLDGARQLLPAETPFPLEKETAARIGCLD
jgi:hypothetical protein